MRIGKVSTDLVEYVLQPLQDGLRDKSPYVRKTAVLGCVKLFYTSESKILECNIPDTHQLHKTGSACARAQSSEGSQPKKSSSSPPPLPNPNPNPKKRGEQDG